MGIESSTLRVNEIFYSLQGEGRRVGEASIFVRLTGCDLACSFCDTEFEIGKQMTLEEIMAECAKTPGTWIVWTGGEPALQLTSEIVAWFNSRGYRQAIETNGGHPVPDGLAWVVCSPKVAEHVLQKNFPNGVNELRYVRHSGQMGVPQPKIISEERYLSPRFDGDRVNAQNLRHCIKLCLENPGWKLSLQSHKLLRIL